MLAFTSATCDEVSKLSETCDSNPGFSGPTKVYQGSHRAFYALCHTSKYLMCAMCFLVMKLLTLAQGMSLGLDESKHLHSARHLNVQ